MPLSALRAAALQTPCSRSVSPIPTDAWAWQLIAGIRAAISPNIDLGLKYRYFNTAKLNFRDSDGVDEFTSTAMAVAHRCWRA